jgi:hypothetical protein
MANRLAEPHDPLVTLLAEFSDYDADFWNAPPSREHLAQWLTIDLPERLRPLEQAWQARRLPSPLFAFYQAADQTEKRDRLRLWLGLSDRPIPAMLGDFPDTIPGIIPDSIRNEFDHYWETKLHNTESDCLDSIDPLRQPGFDRIAQLSLRLFETNPTYLTRSRHKKLQQVLQPADRTKLNALLPPYCPAPLPPDASPEAALAWATKEYLPYRRWDTTRSGRSREAQTSETLADSFVTWIHQHYPILKATPVAASHLNYRATHTVIELSRESPVLWIVVDGLGWLDHEELLTLLAGHQLYSDTDFRPTFSLLPTKTEYAKWGLYAQRTPRRDYWSDNIKQAFETIGIGHRYTDHHDAQLVRDLQTGNADLYCWDTTQLDELYHKKSSWKLLYNTDRPNTLKNIADRIHYFVESHPHPETLRVVIASDHGQLLGECPARITSPPELETCGRIAKGLTDDPRFLNLDRDRFDLPEDLSVVRSDASCNSFSYTEHGYVTGAHGGLFPEEVVIGVSCLRLCPSRSPVIVKITGSGKPGQAGHLQLEVNNCNSIVLTSVSWLTNLDNTDGFPDHLKPGKHTYKIPIAAFPSLLIHSSETTQKIIGKITFRYGNSEMGEVEIEQGSEITIERLYDSGFSLDEFGF